MIEATAHQIDDATTDSRRFFVSVSGVGSSTELRAQAAVLQARIREVAKEERARARKEEKQNQPPSKRNRTGEANTADRDGDVCQEITRIPLLDSTGLRRQRTPVADIQTVLRVIVHPALPALPAFPVLAEF